MLINIVFSYDFDIVDVPNIIGDNVRTYQLACDKWLYDKNNNHDFWIIKNNKKYAIATSSEAFVYYINNILFCGEKASIVKKELNLDSLDLSRPTLYY